MKKIRLWKIIYAICCLVYIGWTINVGTNEFDRINSQYRAILDQFDQNRIRTKALEELVDECRKESKMRLEQEEDACLSWPPAVVEARGQEIEERLLRVRDRGRIKLVFFYAGFVLIFLLAPPVLIYLLIIGIIKLKENIKIVR
jgi:hypothetical protein